MSISTAQWAAGQADINARQIAGDLTESEAAAELLALTLDWSGLIPANGSLPAMGAKVTEFTDLTATRDGDISAWSQGTVDAVITDPAGQPEPGHYPIRVQGGATVWIPSPAAVVSGTQKGDAGANVGQEFAVVAGTGASDPGAGGIKFNHATPGSITAIYVDNLNRGGTDVSAWLDALSTQTTAVRAQLTLRQLDSDKVLTFNVTGAVSSASSYRTIPGVVVGAAVAFDVGSKVVIAPGFTPTMLNEAAAATAAASAGAGLATTAAAAANTARDAALFKAVFATRSLLYASLNFEDKTFGVVWADANPAYNGTYVKSGASGAGAWVKTETAGGLSFQAMPIESGYAAAFVDAGGHMAWAIKIDGTFKPFRFEAPAQSITLDALATAVAQRLTAGAVGPMLQALSPESGPLLAITDALNRIAVSIEPDGTFNARKLQVGTGAVASDNTALTIVSRLLAAAVGAMFQSTSSEIGTPFSIVDQMSRIAVSIESDGTFNARKLKIGAATVADDNTALSLVSRLLGAAVGAYFQAVPAEAGTPLAIVDNQGHVSATVEADGTLYPRRLKVAAATVVDDKPSLTLVSRLLGAAFGACFQSMPQEAGRAFAVTDSAGRVIFGIPFDASKPIEAYVTRAQYADNAISSFGAKANTAYLTKPYLDGGGKYQIRTFRLADGRAFKPTVTGNNIDPAFAPDGRMMFASDVTGAWENYIVPPEGGTIAPLVADDGVINTWGDSLSSNTFQAALAAQTGKTVNSYGIPSQVSGEIMARQGGVPALLTVTSNQIPASGAVSITARSVDFLTSLATPDDTRSMAGTLAGVPVTATKDSSNAYTLTRTTAGSAVACPAGTPFIPDVGSSLRNKAAIIWPGTNDVFYGISRATFLANVLAGADYYLPLVKRLIIIGPLNRSNEPSGSANYNLCVGMNADLAAAAAAHRFTYFDLRSYLIQYGLSDLGITPTSGDLTDIASDIPPRSLRLDSVHLTSTTNAGVVAPQLKLILDSFDI